MVAALLDEDLAGGRVVAGGAVSGRFCPHPLLERLHPAGTAVRASIGLGSRAEDVDRLVDAAAALRRRSPRWTYAGPDHLPVPDPRPLPPWLSDRPALG